jgi:hypothetical protein
MRRRQNSLQDSEPHSVMDRSGEGLFRDLPPIGPENSPQLRKKLLTPMDVAFIVGVYEAKF